MANSNQPETEVAIVGAGPVGLFLAHELIRRGRRVRLLEARAGQSEHSKALAVMPRTMEVFEMAGVVKAFEAAAHHVVSATVYSHKRKLGQIPFEPHASRYDYVAMVPQDVTERLLHEALVAVGGAVEYETDVASIERRDGGATLRLRDGSTCDAQFVVGCDGAHSLVRQATGLPFEGAEYAQTFALVDADTTGDLAEDDMQICTHERGAMAIFPMSARRRRLVATIDASVTREPDLAFANDILAERGPSDLRAESLVWSSLFRIHHRQTPQMRAGALFLAGDAAHIHSPFGAQGMNTGLQDAWNLAWKLDYVLRGWGNDSLLDSYSPERHAVAHNVIRATDILTRTMTVTNPAAQAVRDVAIPVLTRLEPFRAFFVSALSELGVRVMDSPIVEGEGKRAEDLLVDDAGAPRRLYEVLGDRYALLYPQAATPDDVARMDAWAARYGGAVTLRGAHGDGSATVQLVRPDGYVALEQPWAGRDLSATLERAARLLDTHVHASSEYAGSAR